MSREQPQYPEKYYSRIEKIAEESEVFQHPEEFVSVRETGFNREVDGDPDTVMLYIRHGESTYREDLDEQFDQATQVDLTEKGQQHVHDGARKISAILEGLGLKDTPITMVTSVRARTRASERIIRKDLDALGFNFSDPDQRISQTTEGARTFHKQSKEIYADVELLCGNKDIDTYWRSGKLHGENPDFKDLESPQEIENRVLKAFIQSVHILRKISKEERRTGVVIAVGHNEILGALAAKFKLSAFDNKEGRLGYGEAARFYILDDKVILEYSGKNYEFRI